LRRKKRKAIYKGNAPKGKSERGEREGGEMTQSKRIEKEEAWRRALERTLFRAN